MTERETRAREIAEMIAGLTPDLGQFIFLERYEPITYLAQSYLALLERIEKLERGEGMTE